MANLHAACRCWVDSASVIHNASLVLLCIRQSEAELEAYSGEIRDTHRSVACHLGALPVREEHARSKRRPLGLVLFDASYRAAVRVQRGGAFLESVQCSGMLPSPPKRKEAWLTIPQSKSWEVSLAEVVAKIVFAVGHYAIYMKTRDDEQQHLANGVGGAGTGFLEDVF